MSGVPQTLRSAARELVEVLWLAGEVLAKHLYSLICVNDATVVADGCAVGRRSEPRRVGAGVEVYGADAGVFHGIDG